MKRAGQHNDLELLEQIARGDQQAFAMLYTRHNQGIYNFLLGIAKIPALAEDLMQDVFMKIWEDARHIQITTAFAPYLYRVARNKAIDALRRIACDPLLEDEVQHRLASGMHQITDQGYDLREYERLLQQAMAALPPKRRQAFLLVRQEGKKYEEAARLMGISRNTLKEHVSLAVESIRKSLQEHGDIILTLLLTCF